MSACKGCIAVLSRFAIIHERSKNGLLRDLDRPISLSKLVYATSKVS